MISRAGAAAKRHLTALLLDTIIDPKHYADVLRLVCRTLAAPAGLLVLIRRSDDAIIAAHAHGLSSSAIRAYVAQPRLLQADPRLRAALKRPNRPSLCRKLVSDSVLHSSDVYRSFLLPNRLEYALIAPLVIEKDDIVAVWSLMRGPDGPPFDEGDVDRLRSFLPQLRRIAEVTAHRQQGHREEAMLRSLFDRLTVAVVVVDREARIAYENAAAANLLKRQSGFQRVKGRLTHTDPGLASALDAIIESRIAGAGSAKPRYLLVPQSSGAPVLHAAFSVLPRGRESADGWPLRETLVAISLVDPKATYKPDEEVLQASFNLTAAEVKILKCLAEGMPIDQIATLRGSTVGTVRTQISTILSKTGTHRQSDLIRLALTASPLFRDA